jgi:hypothetical protein
MAQLKTAAVAPQFSLSKLFWFLRRIYSSIRSTHGIGASKKRGTDSEREKGRGIERKEH